MSVSDPDNKNPVKLARDERRSLLFLLGLSLVLRLLVLLFTPPHMFYSGGDGPHYLQQGWYIAHNALPLPLTKIGPLYPLMLAAFWLFFPSVPAPPPPDSIPVALLNSIRLFQVVISILLVLAVYWIARRLAGSHTAGLISAAGAGLGPAFIIAPLYILTELMFMLFLAAALVAFVKAESELSARWFALCGLSAALAGMTRPVALMLPFVFLVVLTFQQGPGALRRWSPVLLGTFMLLVLPWSMYLYQTSGSALPEGFGSNLWIGASFEGKWEGTIVTYERSQEFGGSREDFAPEAIKIIASDPFAWLRLRAGNAISALLIPYATADIGGPSLKLLLGEWLREDCSLTGLIRIINLPSFPPKLALYLFHYFALIFGALGAVGSWRRKRVSMIVSATILYLLVTHALLTISPRYLFPAMLLFWVFVGQGLEVTRHFLLNVRSRGFRSVQSQVANLGRDE